MQACREAPGNIYYLRLYAIFVRNPSLFSQVRTSVVIIGALAALLNSCSTTRSIAEWRDQATAGISYHHILVMAVAPDAVIRRAYEDSFVTRLKAGKTDAFSSAAVMPTESEYSRDSILAAINAMNADAVIITRLIGVEEKEVYNPPVYTPLPGYAGLYGYYNGAVRVIYEPGYISRHKSVKLETNLYDAATEKLVWSIRTESIDPSTPDTLIESKIATVIKHLRKQKLI